MNERVLETEQLFESDICAGTDVCKIIQMRNPSPIFIKVGFNICQPVFHIR